MTEASSQTQNNSVEEAERGINGLFLQVRHRGRHTNGATQTEMSDDYSPTKSALDAICTSVTKIQETIPGGGGDSPNVITVKKKLETIKTLVNKFTKESYKLEGRLKEAQLSNRICSNHHCKEPYPRPNAINAKHTTNSITPVIGGVQEPSRSVGEIIPTSRSKSAGGNQAGMGYT